MTICVIGKTPPAARQPGAQRWCFSSLGLANAPRHMAAPLAPGQGLAADHYIGLIHRIAVDLQGAFAEKTGKVICLRCVMEKYLSWRHLNGCDVELLNASGHIPLCLFAPNFCRQQIDQDAAVDHRGPPEASADMALDLSL